MFNRTSLYLFLASSTICSIFIRGAFQYVFLISLLIVLFSARAIIFIFISNREFTKNSEEKGYKYLRMAYKAGGMPKFALNGYIYLSIKLGHKENAIEAIEKTLLKSGDKELKESQKNTLLTQKAVYLWQCGNLSEGVSLLDELYYKGFKTSNFYENYGSLLILDGQLDKAEKLCLEAYAYEERDKVTLDNLVSIYIEGGNWEKAEEFYTKLIELDPSFPEAFYHGAIICLNKKDYDSALELINKAKSFKLYAISSITSSDIKSLEDKIEEFL